MNGVEIRFGSNGEKDADGELRAQTNADLLPPNKAIVDAAADGGAAADAAAAISFFGDCSCQRP